MFQDQVFKAIQECRCEGIRFLRKVMDNDGWRHSGTAAQALCLCLSECPLKVV